MISDWLEFGFPFLSIYKIILTVLCKTWACRLNKIANLFRVCIQVYLPSLSNWIFYRLFAVKIILSFEGKPFICWLFLTKMVRLQILFVEVRWQKLSFSVRQIIHFFFFSNSNNFRSASSAASLNSSKIESLPDFCITRYSFFFDISFFSLSLFDDLILSRLQFIFLSIFCDISIVFRQVSIRKLLNRHFNSGSDNVNIRVRFSFSVIFIKMSHHQKRIICKAKFID